MGTKFVYFHWISLFRGVGGGSILLTVKFNVVCQIPWASTSWSKVETSRGDFLQLMKYHAQSSLTTTLTWTNSLESSPRHLLFIMRSHWQLNSSTCSTKCYPATKFKYKKHLSDLVAPSRLVDMFRRHLNAGSWLPSDNAQGQSIGTRSSKKCVRDQDKLKLWILGIKAQRLSDGSSGLCCGSWVNWWPGELTLLNLNDPFHRFVSLFFLTFMNGTQTGIISPKRLW